MTQEQKELLLKDLCARLPYGVVVDYAHNAFDVHKGHYVKKGSCILYCYLLDTFISPRQNENGEYIKPYLIPLSSMTEKLIHEFYCMFIENDISFEDFVADYWNINSFHKLMTSIDDCGGVVEWFNENHCDYRGLIEKGLAIDATNLNIYYR